MQEHTDGPLEGLSAKSTAALRARVALLALVFAVVALPNVVAAAADLLGR